MAHTEAKKPIQDKFDRAALERELRSIPEPPKGGYNSPQLYRIKPGILGKGPAFIVFGQGAEKLYGEMYDKVMAKKFMVPKRHKLK